MCGVCRARQRVQSEAVVENEREENGNVFSDRVDRWKIWGTMDEARRRCGWRKMETDRKSVV